MCDGDDNRRGRIKRVVRDLHDGSVIAVSENPGKLGLLEALALPVISDIGTDALEILILHQANLLSPFRVGDFNITPLLHVVKEFLKNMSKES